MSQTIEKDPELSGPHSVVESFFIRGRNVLMLDGDLEWLYGHVQEQFRSRVDADEQIRSIFWQGLAAFALHCASKPKNKVIAWTLNLAQPPLNLFYGGDTEWDAVVGRWFTENIDVTAQNRFYQELAGKTGDIARSFVPFQGHDLLLAAEAFYQQSEQRPARFFQLSQTRFLMLAAHPDYDQEWFQNQTQQSLLDLKERETLVFMERRPVYWKCGCSQEKILKVLLPVYEQDPEGLMGGEESLSVQCPRCAQNYRITEEMLEAMQADSLK